MAWLSDLSDLIVPIPGPTRVESAASVARANRIHLTDEDRARLDERFPSGQLRLRAGAVRPGDIRPPDRDVPLRTDAEVVLIMGLPAAGKSTAAHTFVEQGYERLNRDEEGGSLRALLPALDSLIASGRARIVLDNTYVTRTSRAPLIQSVSKHGVPVRCVWISTSLEDAQVNAAWRMVGKYGRLLGPGEMKARSGVGARRSGADADRSGADADRSEFGPGVQFRYQRELEPPHPSEGFSRIDTIRFERVRDASFTNRALIVWCDGVLSRSRSGGRVPKSADDVEVLGERAAVLRRYQADGWRLLGLSWQPEIAEEVLNADQVDEIFRRMQEQIGVAIEVLYLSSRRRASDLLVPEAAAWPWRCLHTAPPTRSVAVRLRRSRSAGSGFRAAARLSVPGCGGFLRRQVTTRRRNAKTRRTRRPEETRRNAKTRRDLVLDPAPVGDRNSPRGAGVGISTTFAPCRPTVSPPASGGACCTASKLTSDDS